MVKPPVLWHNQHGQTNRIVVPQGGRCGRFIAPLTMFPLSVWALGGWDTAPHRGCAQCYQSPIPVVPWSFVREKRSRTALRNNRMGGVPKPQTFGLAAYHSGSQYLVHWNSWSPRARPPRLTRHSQPERCNHDWPASGDVDGHATAGRDPMRPVAAQTPGWMRTTTLNGVYPRAADLIESAMPSHHLAGRRMRGPHLGCDRQAEGGSLPLVVGANDSHHPARCG